MWNQFLRIGAPQPRLGGRQPQKSTGSHEWKSGLCLCSQYFRAGYEYFKRYFYPQANRDAIIDERFNGGGSIADYYIDLLTGLTSRTGTCATEKT